MLIWDRKEKRHDGQEHGGDGDRARATQWGSKKDENR